MNRILCSAAVFCGLFLANVRAEEEGSRNVVVTGENEAEHDQFTEMGEYAQPAWAERSRLSSTTSVYVLSPYELFAGNIWEADVRDRNSVNELIQEIDLGLPHRFELGVENEMSVIDGDAHATSANFETRYAFANWNTIPLNPAVSAEYILGLGPSGRLSDGKRASREPDAIAVRLLLGQNFGDHIGYGANFRFVQEMSHNRHDFDVAQAITYGGLASGKFEIGAEGRFSNISQRGHIKEQNELVIGLTAGWKPKRQLRIGFEPLFGCTDDSPRVASFLLVSYEFGGAEAVVTPVPHD